jgi:hypothetical protein
MKKCFICNKEAIYTIGVALGFSGNDYHFCEDCIKKTTLKELADKIQSEEVQHDKGLD